MAFIVMDGSHQFVAGWNADGKDVIYTINIDFNRNPRFPGQKEYIDMGSDNELLPFSYFNFSR